MSNSTSATGTVLAMYTETEIVWANMMTGDRHFPSLCQKHFPAIQIGFYPVATCMCLLA